VFYASCDKTVSIAGAGGLGGMVIEMDKKTGNNGIKKSGLWKKVKLPVLPDGAFCEGG